MGEFVEEVTEGDNDEIVVGEFEEETAVGCDVGDGIIDVGVIVEAIVVGDNVFDTTLVVGVNVFVEEATVGDNVGCGTIVVGMIVGEFPGDGCDVGDWIMVVGEFVGDLVGGDDVGVEVGYGTIVVGGFVGEV